MPREISLTRGLVAIVDDSDYEWLSRWKWCALAQGSDRFRAVRGVRENGRHKPILMHRAIMQAPPGMTVDHINGDPLDNRRENLRLCQQGLNLLNRRANLTGRKTSKFKGVYWQSDIRRWRARFREQHLGIFTCEVAAAEAYDQAARAHNPGFARLNFPGGGGLSAAS